MSTEMNKLIKNLKSKLVIRLINKIIEDNNLNYCFSWNKISQIEKLAILNNHIDDDILTIIKNNPNLNGSQIADMLPYNKSTVYCHLKRLAADKLVKSKVKNGNVINPRVYSLIK